MHAGLRVLDLEHTFGNFRVIELDGLASLSQLTELRLHIPASLEDTEELYALAHLPARVGLSMPFDGAFDFEHLCTVTSMHFQVLSTLLRPCCKLAQLPAALPYVGTLLERAYPQYYCLQSRCFSFGGQSSHGAPCCNHAA